MKNASLPLISCVLTVFDEGEIARVSIDSVLAQRYGNFELVIVEDGASKETRAVLDDYDDGRIVRIRQSNDGLSSARNRGITHARGKYLCFLDADDLRPQWAFQTLADAIEATGADCILSPGMLVERKNDIVPFYDTPVFDAVVRKYSPPYAAVEGEPDFWEFLACLSLLEPQVANKCVKRDLIMDWNIRFPNGLYFEDFLLQAGLLAHVESIAVTTWPTFTYFQRYGRPQITSTSDMRRFDVISVAHIALDAFARSPRFAKRRVRAGFLVSVFRLVFWCESEISHFWREQFAASVDYLIRNLDPDYFEGLDNPDVLVLLENLTDGEAVLAEIRHRLRRIARNYGPDNVPAHGGMPASAQDTNDRVWVVANLNQLIRKRQKRWRIGKRHFEPLDLDAPWERILEVADAVKTAIPIPEDFDDKEYIEQNADVARACSEGRFRSGYEHYIRHGRTEKRHRTQARYRPSD